MSDPGTCADGPHHAVWPAGSSVAFSPGNLSTSSSASSTLGSPESEEYILSFETIDKMRRVSSYSALNSLIGECRGRAPLPPRWRPGLTGRAGLGTALVGAQASAGARGLQAAASVHRFHSDGIYRPFWACGGRLPEASVCHSPVAGYAVTLPQETPCLSGPGQSSGHHT